MAKLNNTLAAQIEQLTYSLPSFGDTFVENTDEGLKIFISDGDKQTHEAYAEYLINEGLTISPKDDHILITKNAIIEGLNNDKLNNIYKFIITKDDFELTNDFNQLVTPFLGLSYNKLEVSDDKLDVLQNGLDTVLKAHGINHDDFIIQEMSESSITDVMPDVRIGDVIEIISEQDLKDNFGKYVDQLGNINDISMWLNNGGHIEIEITDTLADTINGINVDVRMSDGSSTLPRKDDIEKTIRKFFTDEDIKKHIGNKKLFENFGFENIGKDYWERNPELEDMILMSDLDGDSMVANTDNGILIYSPARELVKVYPNDDKPYVVSPVVNENDANRVLIAVNDSPDSSNLIEELNNMDMTMVMEGQNDNDISKDEFFQIVDMHNVSGDEITKDDLTDEMVARFNKEFKEFLREYPDFDISLNDYEGEQDDKFLDILSSVLKDGNLSIV